MTYALSAGRAAPLGATVDGDGVNFAVFSDNATAMYLCLFDADTGAETRLALPEHTGGVWHGYVAGLRAGQAFMRADENRWALDVFDEVAGNESYDGPEVRAQAMYWAGMCHQAMRAEMAAYSTFKRLTYDFPESTWASYARGQLSTERLLRLETRLEIERLEGEANE